MPAGTGPITVSYSLVEAHLWLWSYCRCELPGWVMLCLGLSAAALIGLYGAYRTNPTAGRRFRKTRPRAGWWLASAIGFLGVMTFSAEFRPGGVLLALALAAVIGLLGHRRTLRGAVSRRHRTRLQSQVWLASTLGFFGMMRFVSPLQPAWHLLGLAASAAGLYAMLGGDRHCRTVLSWGRRLRRPRYSFPFWCFVCFLAGNAAMSLLMARGVRMWLVAAALGPATLGMLAGQAAVHSIWCVFSPLPWAQRFLAGAISAIALCAGFVIPPALFERRWRLDVVDDLACRRRLGRGPVGRGQGGQSAKG